MNQYNANFTEQVVEYEEIYEDQNVIVDGQYYEDVIIETTEDNQDLSASIPPVRYGQIEQSSSKFRSLDSINTERVKPIGDLQNVRAKIGTSLVYTPPSIANIKKETGTFTPNFSNLLSSKSPKPTKIRKIASKRKPCNCTKSMCLKLYCDCFASGEFCLDCNCRDCHNNLEHESERSKAIKSSLERNPSAFKPKIGVAAKALGKAIDMERLHQRGCHCKKSNCLKNYCECYEAKVPCTERCKCVACRNTEHDRHNKFRDKFSTTAGGLAQLAAAAAADTRTHSSSPFSELEGSEELGEGEEQRGRLSNYFDPKTFAKVFKYLIFSKFSQPWFYMTEDVIEATTMCLVSQAQELEHDLSEEELEKSVLKEFGRCLEQIIESATSCLPFQIQQQHAALTPKHKIETNDLEDKNNF
ncbi:CRC domain-containing protein [Meloidogyne graminicola]|uniref:CRC domain-containing protein n=1 Tax=Meloidogyne graminicola TaxID=189291 RepID=A0A8S9ZXD7_9BILA|nr:CRC domain-containing protein [Meloidogyne graminicola]